MFIKPMLLDSREDVFNSDDFIYEPKSNGVRLELISTNNGIKLFTRHGNDITLSFPEIASLDVEEGIVLDGELVCYDPQESAKEDFEGVMSRLVSKKQSSINSSFRQHPSKFIVFDILKYKNESVMNLPLIERKEILNENIVNQSHLSKVVSVKGNGSLMYNLVKQYNLEGMVAKRSNSRYQVGKRPKGVWYKIINWQYSECIITGYRKGETGWYLGIEFKGEIQKVGMVEFGISPKQKKKFYQMAEELKAGESEKSIWIKSIIRCKIKHRGFLRSGNMMTPVFIEFLS